MKDWQGAIIIFQLGLMMVLISTLIDAVRALA